MVEDRFAGKSIPESQFSGDDGQASPQVTAALDDFVARRITRAQLFETLLQSRVFVPVKAILDSHGIDEHGHKVEKDSHMATVSIQAADGRKALLAFTSTPNLTEWDEQARPIAAHFATAIAAALDEGADALLVDFRTDHQIAVTRREMLLIANHLPVVDPFDDDVAMAILSEVLQSIGTERGVTFEVSPAINGADVAIALVGSQAGQADAILQEVAAGLNDREELRLRLAGGIALSIKR